MRKIGFVINSKEGDNRLALLPKDIISLRNKSLLVGAKLGIDDKDYVEVGASIGTRDVVLKCDIVIDVKIGDANFFEEISGGKILVGWAHAVQNAVSTDFATKGKHTVIAWENIYNKWKKFSLAK